MNGKTSESWEHFHHVADIGVRGYGTTIEQAFEQAAIALTAVITDPALVDAEKSVSIHCEAPDIELLFADWLNALIYEMATRKMLFSKFDVTIDKFRLSAKVWGEIVDVKKHNPSVEVKGATYTALKVYQDDNNRWVTQCVVDV